MSESAQSLAQFSHFREQMNAAILAADNLVIKRFFSLDTQTDRVGALDARTKQRLRRAVARLEEFPAT